MPQPGMAARANRLRSKHASCAACGRLHDIEPGTCQCDCARQENLSICCDLGPATRASLLKSVEHNEHSLWRYAPLMPVDRRFGTHLSVGWTPLYDFGDYRGTRFFLKDETRNPSGSLKDRASEAVMAVAAAHDIADVIVASTGNAAASLACIGAAAGIQVTILVPRTVPSAKLAQILAYGASVYRVDGTYDDAYRLAQKVSAAKGIFNRSTGLNPFTREGKKTCAFEIAEQLGWQTPDWVVVPTGDGNILSGIWKGFHELAALDLLPALPRLVAAQSAASDVIVRTFDVEWAKAAIDPPLHTIADSITVAQPRDLTSALAALSASKGMAVAVDDDEIIAATRSLASGFGVFCEPSSAAGFAAFERLRQRGTIKPHELVVCLATGTGLKDLRAVPATDTAPVIAPDAWQEISVGGVQAATPRSRRVTRLHVTKLAAPHPCSKTL
jgi:threonine synthase